MLNQQGFLIIRLHWAWAPLTLAEPPTGSLLPFNHQNPLPLLLHPSLCSLCAGHLSSKLVLKLLALGHELFHSLQTILFGLNWRECALEADYLLD